MMFTPKIAANMFRLTRPTATARQSSTELHEGKAKAARGGHRREGKAMPLYLKVRGLSRAVSLSLSISLFFYFFLALSLFLSISIIYIYIYLYLSLSLSFSLSLLSFSLPLIVCLCVPLSCAFLCWSQFFPPSQSLFVAVSWSLFFPLLPLFLFCLWFTSISFFFSLYLSLYMYMYLSLSISLSLCISLSLPFHLSCIWSFSCWPPCFPSSASFTSHLFCLKMSMKILSATFGSPPHSSAKRAHNET